MRALDGFEIGCISGGERDGDFEALDAGRGAADGGNGVQYAGFFVDFAREVTSICQALGGCKVDTNIGTVSDIRG